MESFLEKKANGCQMLCFNFCKTAPMCASEASVAKESLAQECGWCKGTADGKSDLALSNAICMAGVQDRIPVPEVA